MSFSPRKKPSRCPAMPEFPSAPGAAVSSMWPTARSSVRSSVPGRIGYFELNLRDSEHRQRSRGRLTEGRAPGRDPFRRPQRMIRCAGTRADPGCSELPQRVARVDAGVRSGTHPTRSTRSGQVPRACPLQAGAAGGEVCSSAVIRQAVGSSQCPRRCRSPVQTVCRRHCGRDRGFLEVFTMGRATFGGLAAVATGLKERIRNTGAWARDRAGDVRALLGRSAEEAHPRLSWRHSCRSRLRYDSLSMFRASSASCAAPLRALSA